MQLKSYEEYKNRIIYININNGCYIVYEDEDDEIAREAVRLFVMNDIDVNMPVFSYNISEELVKNDIDVADIISRSEKNYGMQCWI